MTTFRIGEDFSPYAILAGTDRKTFSPREALILESLSGWDDMPETIRNSSEKIVGNGEFVSRHWRMNGRLVEASLVYIKTDGSGVRNLRTKIAAWKTSNDLFPLTVSRQVGDEAHEEVLQNCYISGDVLWDERDERFVRVNLLFKSKDSFKTLYVDGINEGITVI